VSRTFKTYSNCSLSLSALMAPVQRAARVAPRRMIRALSLTPIDREPEAELIRVMIETASKKQLDEAINQLGDDEEVVRLASESFAATLSVPTLRSLVRRENENLRISTKKQSKPRLNEVGKDMLLFGGSPVARKVAQTGKGVFIGIVDSGFDLTHPAFLDANGKLRVKAMLVQRTSSRGRDKEFTTAQLEQELSNGNNPGVDADGHGTHVAGIAGGTKHRNFEGVAPGATFLLAKTNFIDTDKAVSWIFSQAGSAPCVVNLSLGSHFGAHDGSDSEERLHDTLSGRGRIIVVAAGNERNDSLHIGGRFSSGETHTVTFDVLPSEDGSLPEAVLTLWFSPVDTFAFTLISPSGQEFTVPTANRGLEDSAAGATIKLMRGLHQTSGLLQVQVQVLFRTTFPPLNRLRKWRLRCTCESAALGRLDGWFANSGFAVFRSHALVETARTIGLPATSKTCIAVASHVSKVKWPSDLGQQQDSTTVVGRSSDFSSLGPTLDGREKPEISAPGQFVTAALAFQSELEEIDDRSLDSQRLATIEGTSMAAPAIAGVIALMLEKRATLTPSQAHTILADSARKDDHTGSGGWNPMFGFGKIEVVKAMSLV